MAEDSTARNESIAGIVAGFTCKLTEHPFDTVKVQAQTQSFNSGKLISPLTILKDTVRKDGWLALYRGLPSPLLSSMGENMILFGAYGFGVRMIHGDKDNVPLWKQFLSGGFSGGCVSFLMTPTELIKCRMQTTNENVRHYRNTWECIVVTIKNEGVRGLFRGQVSTMFREIPGNAAWFAGYELGIYLLTPQGKTKQHIHPVGLAAAGALGGMCYWSFPFPFDVVKSKIQTGTHGLPDGVRPTVANVLRHVYRTEGVVGLYRGLALTLLRAAPTNAVLFLSYELTFRLLAGQRILGGS